MKFALFNPRFVLLLFVLTSCIGTIEDTEKKKTIAAEDQEEAPFRFDGVLLGRGIAHNAANLKFTRARGGSGQFSYSVYQNTDFENAVASASGQLLEPDAEGFYNLKVSNLERGVRYSFSVRATDLETGKEDINTEEVVVETLDYLVPLFDGVRSIENVSGIDGQTKLKVKWLPANAPVDDLLGTSPDGVDGYKVYYGIAVNALTNVKIVTSATATETNISGLSPDTPYYVRVRAFDRDAEEDQNSIVKVMSTKGVEPIQFAGLQEVAVPQNNSGYNNLDLSWDENGSGSFSQYRIYHSTTEPGIEGFDKNDHFKTITDLDVFTERARSLEKNQFHYFAVAACDSPTTEAECVGNDKVIQKGTRPDIIPFDSLISVAAPSGEEGVDSLVLEWDPILPNTGVFDEIKVFWANSGSGDLEVEADPEDAGTPVLNFASTNSGPTKRVVTNLTPGETYCFYAKAFIGDSSPVVNGTEESGSGASLCGVPQFTAPSFGDFECSVNGAEVRCTWDSPEGVYDSIELVWIDQSKGSIDWTEIEELGAPGDDKYGVKSFGVNDTAGVIRNLTPSSGYEIGLRTKYSGASEPPTPNNNTVEIQTPDVKAEHGGWVNIMALGPKIRAGGAVFESLNRESNGLIYPIEDGVDGNNAGLVNLVIKDFQLEGLGNNVFNFIWAENGGNSAPNNAPPSSVGISGKDGTGYRVYRKPVESWLEPRPSLSNNAAWTPVSDGIVRPKKMTDYQNDRGEPGNTLYYVEFQDKGLVDDNVGNTAYERNNGSPFRPDEASYENHKGYARAYWYKFVLEIEGRAVDFAGDQGDVSQYAIAKVVLPPNNMALVHPWIANKEMCDMMHLEPDPLNNYRCEYNGLGSTNVDGTNYYDVGGYLLVDRFEMGMNYSREACEGDAIEFFGSSAFYESGEEYSGLSLGDCIGSVAPDSSIKADQGSVYVLHPHKYAYVQTALDRENPIWVLESSLENSDQGKAGSAIYNTWGKNLYTNESGKPPLGRLTANNLHNACASHDITLNFPDGAGDFVGHSTVWEKRLWNRKEQIAASSNPDLAAESVMSQIRDGDETDLDVDGFSNDCNSNIIDGIAYRSENATPEEGKYAFDKSVTFFNSISNSYSRQVLTGTGRLQDQDVNTEKCVTRFGLQDVFGNSLEFTRDQFYCDTVWGCSAAFQSSNLSQSAAATGQFSTASNWSPVPDPTNKEVWRNGDSTATNPGDDTYLTFGVSDTIGKMPISGTGSTSVPYKGNATYFSVPLGIPLINDTNPPVTDDNYRVTATGDSTLESVVRVGFDVGDSRILMFEGSEVPRNSGNGVTGAGAIAMTVAGHYSENNVSRWSARIFRAHFVVDENRSGRCSSLIPWNSNDL